MGRETAEETEHAAQQLFGRRRDRAEDFARRLGADANAELNRVHGGVEALAHRRAAVAALRRVPQPQIGS